jgi:hypothetical protein
MADSDTADAITRAATEDNIDPAFALAVANRESAQNGLMFDPNARASKSIYGIFQMSGPLRSQWGSGNSSDAYTQAKGWTGFINDQKQQLQQRLGRDPTDPELYLAHYWGTSRAAKIINGQTPADTPVQDVFTPQELRGNPNLVKLGTVGNAANDITADITQRYAKFGGTSPWASSQLAATPGGTGGGGGAPGTDYFGPSGAQSPASAPTSLASYGSASFEPPSQPHAAATPANPLAADYQPQTPQIIPGPQATRRPAPQQAQVQLPGGKPAMAPANQQRSTDPTQPGMPTRPGSDVDLSAMVGLGAPGEQQAPLGLSP